VPSEKRARQRAARAQKQAVVERRRKRRRNGRRGLIALALVAVIVIVVVLIQSSGSGPKKKSSSPATSSSSSTTTTSTFAVPTTQPFNTTAADPTCPPAKGSSKRVVWFKHAPGDCIKKTSVWDATFSTSVGSFTVKMPAASSYAAVNNFVFLALYHYYDGTFFHRVIPGFVVQGGDPTGTGSGGTHHLPGYSFTGNYPPASCKTNVTAACYQVGDLVMANSNPNPQVQDASTDGSQFFFVLPGGQTTLNGEPTYTIFGQVTSGLSVVEKIGSLGTSSGTPKTKVYLLKVTVTQVKA
jgi:cyclophilin family peptidyl-prolyl cis-trans isomerase